MGKSLPAIFKKTVDRYPQGLAYAYRPKRSEPYVGITWQELHDRAIGLAISLSDAGLEPHDHVAILSDNRLEWILSDLAILMNGAVDVPRGVDITDEEILYIINHSESTMVFVEHKKMLDRVLKLKDKLSNVQKYIVMDPGYIEERSEVISLSALIEKGKKSDKTQYKMIEKRMNNIHPDDLFTIIYTSGTTGNPKGVMLTHNNMVSQVNSIAPMVNLNANDRGLSILPIWHVFERAVEYLFLSVGAPTYYTNIRNLVVDLKEVKPTIMASAPRLWETVYNKIKIASGEGFKKALFNLAIYSSSKCKAAARFLKGNTIKYKKARFLVQLVEFFKHIASTLLWFIPATALSFIPRKLRMITGGNLRFTISGGGALPVHIDAFFNDIGIVVLEGYGMTECSPVISVRSLDKVVIGSVGGPIPETQVEIRNINDLNNTMPQGQSGVIFVKGPQVMIGYYKNIEATKKVLNDGWINTGDIGMINFNNTISITGRAKDTVVLLSGENVEPVPIENKLTNSEFIAQAMVVGQDKKQLGALIVVDEEKVNAWAKENMVEIKGYSDLISNDKTKSLIKSEIRTLISSRNGFKPFETIGGFYLLPKPFEVGDELNNMFKMKRHVITKKYNDVIQNLYV